MSDQTDPRSTAVATSIVQTVSPAPRDRWRRVMAADPHAMVTQSPEWVDVMTATSNRRDGSIWFESADGRELVLPMARQRVGGSVALQSSFGEGWGMGGVLAAGGPTPEDVAAVIEHLRGQSAMQTALRPNPLLGEIWQSASHGRDVVTIPKSAHVLDLAGGADAVFGERFDKHGRRGVRRAQRLGVEVTSDTSRKSIGVFYGMFLQSLTRWAERSREPQRMAVYRGTRRDPIEKFETMADKLGSALRLYLAYLDGVPAAGALVLVGANAHYTRGVMDVDVAGRTNAADLVQWSAIQDAAAAGCHSYHMGETGTSVSLARFKEKFGARPVPYALHRIERMPLTAADQKLRAAVKKLIGFQDG